MELRKVGTIKKNFFFFEAPKLLGVLQGPNRFIPKSVLFLGAKDSQWNHVFHVLRLLGTLGALKQSRGVGDSGK